MPVVDPVNSPSAVIATLLRDEYPLPPECMERFGKREYERATLHPEIAASSHLAAESSDQIFEVVYRELIRNLRHDLRINEIPVPYTRLV